MSSDLSESIENDKAVILDLLRAHDQEHLLQFWDELSLDEKTLLLNDIKAIDFSKINLILNKPSKPGVDFSSLKPPFVRKKSDADDSIRLIGENAIRNGELAVLLLAGGQGSRLGFKGPKGCFPITPLKKKSLYQLFSEKLLSACNYFGVRIDFYIMTSAVTHDETVKHFEDNDFFGLDPSQVVFFQQDLLPAVSFDGKVLLRDKHRVNMVPTGTGTVFKSLLDSGLIDRMKKKGIKYFQYLQIDDALAVVADPVFLGFHIKDHSVYSSKVVEKKNPAEPVGVFAVDNGRLRIIEYIHLPNELALKRDDSGKLVFSAVNIASHIINTDFAFRVATELELDFYLAKKKVSFIDSSGSLISPDEPNAFKFESFSFDALPYAEKTLLLEVNRDEEFAPVKYSSGDSKTPRIAQEQLIMLAKKWLLVAGISGEVVDSLSVVEISPLFAFDINDFSIKVSRVKDWLEQRLRGSSKAYIN